MNGKPRRRRSYVASQRPDFNDSLEKWAAYLKVENEKALAKALVKWRDHFQRRTITASDK